MDKEEKMISVVILAKNEEDNLKDCLKSLVWCDEIILIDDNSTDQSVNIAKSFRARIYTRALNNDFAAQRNFGLEKAKGKWVLFVDADERVAEAVASEIKYKISNIKDVCGYYVRRFDNIWGRELKHGETGNIKLLRLAKKGAGKWERKVHEVWNITGKTQILDNPLLHYPHKSLKQFITKVDYYSSLDAEWKRENGIRSSLLHILLWPIFKFFANWILSLGFLDGSQGFLMAAVMSLHSYLSWSKTWILQKKSS